MIFFLNSFLKLKKQTNYGHLFPVPNTCYQELSLPKHLFNQLEKKFTCKILGPVLFPVPAINFCEANLQPFKAHRTGRSRFLPGHDKGFWQLWQRTWQISPGLHGFSWSLGRFSQSTPWCEHLFVCKERYIYSLKVFFITSIKQIPFRENFLFN